MIETRIRELREARGWSQLELGIKVGRDKDYIHRLEAGKTRLDLETAYSLADIFDVSVEEIVVRENQRANIGHYSTQIVPGLSEDITPYEPAPDDPLALQTGENRFPFTVETDSLEKMGIRRGDVVIIDESAEAVRAVKALQAVEVNWSDPISGQSKLLLRQFVPPSLLITNSPNNQRSLDTTVDKAYITGVVISQHRRLS